MPNQLLQAAANALVLGSLIGLLAVGYSLVYGVARLLNFAHGEIFVLGAYYLFFLTSGVPPGIVVGVLGLTFLVLVLAVFSLQRQRGTTRRRLSLAGAAAVAAVLALWPLFRGGVPLPLAFLVAAGLTMAVGLAVEFVGYRPLADGPRIHCLISAIGLSLALQGAMQILFGTEQRSFGPAVKEDLSFLESMLDACGLARFFSGLDVVIVLSSAGATAGTWWVVERSRLGLSVRAVSEDPGLAAGFGVDVPMANMVAFAMGALLACLAALLFVARESTLEPTLGYRQGLLAFCAAVLGGIGRLRGAYAGGLIIGAVLSFVPLLPLEQLGAIMPGGAGYLPSLQASDWNYGAVYAMMILLILVRPRGLFAESHYRSV